ncbi:MAG: hypothetical protein ACKVJE_20195 [Pseudomonadales bacterium]
MLLTECLKVQVDACAMRYIDIGIMLKQIRDQDANEFKKISLTDSQLGALIEAADLFIERRTKADQPLGVEFVGALLEGNSLKQSGVSNLEPKQILSALPIDLLSRYRHILEINNEQEIKSSKELEILESLAEGRPPKHKTEGALTKRKTDKKAAIQSIQGILDDLTKLEALQVIQKILIEYFGQVDTGSTLPKLKKTVRITRGRLSKIQMDEELEAFILSNMNNASQKSLLTMCIDQFGKGRAPSRSALQRYLTDLTTTGEHRRSAP